MNSPGSASRAPGIDRGAKIDAQDDGTAVRRNFNDVFARVGCGDRKVRQNHVIVGNWLVALTPTWQVAGLSVRSRPTSSHAIAAHPAAEPNDTKAAASRRRRNGDDGVGWWKT